MKYIEIGLKQEKKTPLNNTFSEISASFMFSYCGLSRIGKYMFFSFGVI